MGALRPDCENILPAADQQDGLIPDMADELATVGKIDDGDTLGEIGTARRCSSFSHPVLLWQRTIQQYRNLVVPPEALWSG
jgi:hypothetical protein